MNNKNLCLIKFFKKTELTIDQLSEKIGCNQNEIFNIFDGKEASNVLIRKITENFNIKEKEIFSLIND